MLHFTQTQYLRRKTSSVWVSACNRWQISSTTTCSRAGFYHPPSATLLTAAPLIIRIICYCSRQRFSTQRFVRRRHNRSGEEPRKAFSPSKACKNGSNSDSVDDWQPSSPPVDRTCEMQVSCPSEHHFVELPSAMVFVASSINCVQPVLSASVVLAWWLNVTQARA